MGSRSTAACALVVFRERMDAVQIVAAAVLLAGLGVLLAPTTTERRPAC